ncbi:MAG: MarR family winged helix-turn-helix transcriptional regulator [Burkholderiaceae bacterium]
MKRSPEPEKTADATAVQPCPWADLNEAGDGLTVDNFLTTLMSHVGNALRRTVTLPYAEQHGMTVAEWRMLSVLAQAHTLPFSELVVLSSTDKALVSRTLRLLEERGLVELHSEGNTPRKKLICIISPAGQALHDQVIPIARQRQAAMLRVLSPEERRVMHRSLKKLQQACIAGPADGKD